MGINRNTYKVDTLTVSILTPHEAEGDAVRVCVYDGGGASLTYPTTLNPAAFFQKALGAVQVKDGLRHPVEVFFIDDNTSSLVAAGDLPDYSQEQYQAIHLEDEVAGVCFGWQSIPGRPSPKEGGLIAPDVMPRNHLELLLRETGSLAISTHFRELTDEIMSTIQQGHPTP